MEASRRLQHSNGTATLSSAPLTTGANWTDIAAGFQQFVETTSAAVEQASEAVEQASEAVQKTAGETMYASVNMATTGIQLALSEALTEALNTLFAASLPVPHGLGNC